MVLSSYKLGGKKGFFLDELLRKDRPLDEENVINWPEFVNLKAKKIGCKLSKRLEGPALSKSGHSLAQLNLEASRKRSLKSGQDFFKKIQSDLPDKVRKLISLEMISSEEIKYLLPEISDSFTEATPLWIYFLIEAQCRNKNGGLGPLGAIFVMETLKSLALRSRINIFSDSKVWSAGTDSLVFMSMGLRRDIRFNNILWYAGLKN